MLCMKFLSVRWQFEREGRSCVDVAVGCSIETLETEAEGDDVKRDNSRWWWHQIDSHRLLAQVRKHREIGWNKTTTVTSTDEGFKSLEIGSSGESPPGTGSICQLGDDDRSVNCLQRDVVHAVSMQDSESVQSLRTRTDYSMNVFATERLFVKVTPSIFMVVTRTMPGSGGGGWAFFFLRLLTKTISVNLAGLVLTFLIRAHSATWLKVFEIWTEAAV